MVFNNNCNSTIVLLSSLFVAVGLPLGFYVVFTVLDPIEHLKYASSAIGEGFIRGIQNGINETALNELVKKLANTLIAGTTPSIDEYQLRG